VIFDVSSPSLTIELVEEEAIESFDNTENCLGNTLVPIPNSNAGLDARACLAVSSSVVADDSSG
jgi:hypothetical protein